MKLLFFYIGVFALAAACAPTTQTASSGPSGRDCFNAGSINGYGTVSDQTVRVSVGASRDYDLDIEGPGCRDIKWSNSIAVVAKPSPWICVGDKFSGDVSFRDTGSSTVTSCYIKDVRRYVKPAPGAPSAAR
jgi:Family of unknown function (DUF6491)